MSRRAAAVASLLLASVATGTAPAASIQEGETRYITGGLGFHVDDQEPLITLRADWVWFPLEEVYPFDNIGEEGRVRVDPRILTAYVNFGCHFEGFTRWRYEEMEIEELDDGRIRRRLEIDDENRGGFYNNEQRFKCELATKNRRLNELLGTLVTTGNAPTSGFQSSIVQVVYMRMIDAINTMDRVPGSWGDYLYDTFKSIMTFNLMDDTEGEVDLYFAPEGDVMEFEISRQRTVRFER